MRGGSLYDLFLPPLKSLKPTDTEASYCKDFSGDLRLPGRSKMTHTKNKNKIKLVLSITVPLIKEEKE